MTLLYATLTEAKHELREDATVADATNDPRFVDALRVATAMVDRITGYFFAPAMETRYVHSQGFHVDDDYRVLYLPVPLCEVTEIRLGAAADGTGGTVLAAATGYEFYPKGRACTFALRRIDSGWSAGVSAFVESIRIAGVWGFRYDYASAWEPSGATLSADLAASATSASVSSADAFSVGHLLRLVTGTTTEYVVVTAVSGTTLTLTRAQRGSASPVTHASGTAFSIWRPQPDIVYATARLAGWLFRRRGQYEVSTFDGISSVKYPTDIPLDIASILFSYTDKTPAGA